MRRIGDTFLPDDPGGGLNDPVDGGTRGGGSGASSGGLTLPIASIIVAPRAPDPSELVAPPAAAPGSATGDRRQRKRAAPTPKKPVAGIRI